MLDHLTELVQGAMQAHYSNLRAVPPEGLGFLNRNMLRGHCPGRGYPAKRLERPAQNLTLTLNADFPE